MQVTTTGDSVGCLYYIELCTNAALNWVGPLLYSWVPMVSVKVPSYQHTSCNLHIHGFNCV